MAKAQSVADVLEECRQRLARGATMESCLAAYPHHADELAALLPLLREVQALRRYPDLTFADGARRRFRARVQAARVEQTAARAAGGPLTWLRRLAVPIALVVVLAASGVGLVRVSADALPNSPLYPVQQVSQHLQRQLQATPEAKATFDMQVAAKRLRQLEGAEALGLDPQTVNRLAASMVEATNRAVVEVDQTEGDSHDTLVQRMAPLLSREAVVLRRRAGNPNQGIASPAGQLQAQVSAAQQHLQERQPAATKTPTPSRRPSHPLSERLRQLWLLHHHVQPPVQATPCATPRPSIQSRQTGCTRPPVHPTPSPRLSP